MNPIVHSSVPLFPQFTSLTPELKEVVGSFASEFGPNADYNFVSLWCYNVENDIIISNLNGNLVVRFRDYLTNQPFFSFLGTNAIVDTIEALFEYEKNLGIVPELKLISETIAISDHLHEKYYVQEDRDNFDYILSVDEIRRLEGQKFHTHRNHINTFRRLYPNHAIEIYTEIDEKVKNDMQAIFDSWMELKGDKADGHEERAFGRLFEILPFSRLLVVILKNHNKPVAFLVSDLHDPSVSQIHFAKADPSIRQAYYIINQVLAEELTRRGHSLINLENDLGIPGLRYAKEQWNPVQFVKKYTIRPRN